MAIIPLKDDDRLDEELVRSIQDKTTSILNMIPKTSDVGVLLLFCAKETIFYRIYIQKHYTKVTKNIIMSSFLNWGTLAQNCVKKSKYACED